MSSQPFAAKDIMTMFPSDLWQKNVLANIDQTAFKELNVHFFFIFANNLL